MSILVKNGLFRTPKDSKEVFKWIDNLPPENRIVAYTPLFMMLNFIADNYDLTPKASLEPSPKSSPES